MLASLSRSVRQFARAAVQNHFRPALQLVPAGFNGGIDLGASSPAALPMDLIRSEGHVESFIDSPFWFAVPKSRITRSRKRMRSANKGLKNLTNIQSCELTLLSCFES
jgi:hypothetical protein